MLAKWTLKVFVEIPTQLLLRMLYCQELYLPAVLAISPIAIIIATAQLFLAITIHTKPLLPEWGASLYNT